MGRWWQQRVRTPFEPKVWPFEHNPGMPGEPCKCRCSECIRLHHGVDEGYVSEAT